MPSLAPTRKPLSTPLTQEREHHVHHDTDDTSEKATVLSEGSTLPEEALMAMHGGGGSKRARMMVKAAQPVRAVLTRAAIEALETRQALAGPPAQNLRSAPHAEESQQLIMDSFGLPPPPPLVLSGHAASVTPD